jgi:hypothetical protein
MANRPSRFFVAQDRERGGITKVMFGVSDRGCKKYGFGVDLRAKRAVLPTKIDKNRYGFLMQFR